MWGVLHGWCQLRSLYRGITALLGPMLLCIGSTVAPPAQAGEPLESFTILWDRAVPKEAFPAFDIRFLTEESVWVTSSKEGIHSIELDNLSVSDVAYTAEGDIGCYTCSRLGLSEYYLATARGSHALSYRPVLGEDAEGMLYFATIVDIDVQGSRLLFLGSRWEDKVWAPGGEIAWTGSLDDKLTDLRPILASVYDPDLKIVGKCGFMETGAVRFLANGDAVIVPGVEDGAYLFDYDFSLKRTWSLERFGLARLCDELSEDERLHFLREPEPRFQWINSGKIIEDVIELPDGVGLIVRSVHDGVPAWRLFRLPFEGNEVTSVVLPFRGQNDLSFLRADSVGTKVIFLMYDYGLWRKDHKPSQSRLILTKYNGIQ